MCFVWHFNMVKFLLGVSSWVISGLILLLWVEQTSFEETRMSAADLGDKTKWLKEGMECQVLLWNDKVFS